jgi:hypothetical protein
VVTGEGALGRVLMLFVLVWFFMPEWSTENLIRDALFVLGVAVVLFGEPDFDD